MNANTKKLIAAAVLLVAAVVVYLSVGRSSSALPSSIKYVCVATGKVFDFAPSDIPSILPGKNPSTGQMTLLPATEKDGKLYASPRYARDLLRDPEFAKVNKYVDPSTYEVLKTPRQ
jgi:hypothetical protein